MLYTIGEAIEMLISQSRLRMKVEAKELDPS